MTGRDETGIGLWTTLVAMFLGAIVIAAAVTGFGTLMRTSYTAEAQVAAKYQARFLLGQIEQEVGNAEYISHCASDPSGEYATAYDQCQRPLVSTDKAARPVYLAAGNEVCFFSLPPGAPVSDAPDYTCIDEHTDGNLYLTRTPPDSGLTATTCNPAGLACWSGSSGETSRLLGELTPGSTVFSYVSTSGEQVALPASNPDVELISVTLSVPVRYRADSPYEVTTQLAVNGTTFATQGNWSGT